MTVSSSDFQPPRISLTVTPEVLERFCLLTGDGFRIRVRLGDSLRDTLCRQWGIDSGYLDGRIQTVLLDGQVVDDPDAAWLTPGATLALSAAMPGIAGAMLRKQSPYAPMRSRLSYARRGSEPGGPAEGEVVVKLFNLVQRELGPLFLHQGIRISGRALQRLLAGRWEAFRPGILAAEIGAEAVEPRALLDNKWENQEVVLAVRRATA